MVRVVVRNGDYDRSVVRLEWLGPTLLLLVVAAVAGLLWSLNR
jgi:hypothetical protein